MPNKSIIIIVSFLIFICLFTLLALHSNGQILTEEIAQNGRVFRKSGINIEEIKDNIAKMDPDEIESVIKEIEKEIDRLQKELDNY